MTTLSPEYVRQRLNYDPETGVMTWKTSERKSKVGAVAGGSKDGGYVQIYLKGRFYGAHRLAWMIMTGSWPTLNIDHRNLNPSDNRWSNLREASKSDNAKNTRIRADNKSGFKGVCWDRARKKWRADIRLPHVRKHLGLFSDPKEDHAAYAAAVEANYGEFGRAS